MSFKLLSISSMYSGYMDSFYVKYPEITTKSYNEHLHVLLEDSTEFVASYNRTFRKLEVDANCIIANDKYLQKKWVLENGLKTDKQEEIIFKQVKFFSPEILWIENMGHITLDLLNTIRNQVKSIKLIIGYHCAPFNQNVLEVINGVDFLITCTPGLQSIIENKGKKTFLVYHGFDKELLKKIQDKNGILRNDLIFSGSLISGGDFHSKRKDLIETILRANIEIGLFVNLESKYKIRAKQSIFLLSNLLRKAGLANVVNKNRVFDYGKTWVDNYSPKLMGQKFPPVYGIDMYNLFKQSGIVLNFHIGVAGDYAGNMRMFEVTGVGSCLLTDDKKNMKDLFQTGSEVVVYEGVEDCIEKIKWLLENENERKKIASSGQSRTLKDHTVENRCKTIIEIINKELSSFKN
jgi:spore maturation protein CgeB